MELEQLTSKLSKRCVAFFSFFFFQIFVLETPLILKNYLTGGLFSSSLIFRLNFPDLNHSIFYPWFVITSVKFFLPH